MIAYCRRIRTVFGSVGKVSLIHQNLLYMLLMVVLMILTLLKHLSTFSVGSVLCRPNSILQNDQIRDQFLAQFEKYVGAETDLSVSINAVANSICRLKKGKAPGIDGIMACLLYTSPSPRD